MRSGQDGKRRHPFWMLIRDLPCKAGAPIVADEVEPPIAISDSGHDIERVPDEAIDSIAGVISWIRPALAAYPRWFGATAK
jgi:hypothetical protein